MVITIVFVLFVVIAKSNATVNPHGPTIELDFTNCLYSLVGKNFGEPAVLIFANSNNASTPVSRIWKELLKRINKKNQYVVEIMTPGREVDVCDNYDEKLGISHVDSYEAKPLSSYFIVIIDSYEDFPYVASKLLRSSSWNPSAKFIILIFKFTADKRNLHYAERIVSCLFKYNAFNVVVAVPKANNLRSAIIYGWRPYDPPTHCGYFNETAHDRLLIENTCVKGALKYNRSVFEENIPSDMTGCVLHVIALERQPFVSRDVDDANIEKILINEIVSRYKFRTSYEVINAFRGERERMRQWNGALKELIKKRGQVLLGGIFPDYDVHEDFESSLSYLSDSYTWVVPRAYHSPAWEALIIIFKKLVWLSVIVGYTFCAISWSVLGQLSKDSAYNASLRHCFLNAWICSLGFCSYSRPSRNSLQIFFVFFNIYCVVFLTAYQTKLIDVLKNPSYEYQIQSVQDLVESGLNFGGFEEVHDLFMNGTDPLDKYIYDHWIDVSNTSVAMLDVAVHRNFSVLCRRLELSHISAVMPDLSDSDGNFKYYAFELNMFTVPIEMVALRGFAFMKKFSETLSLFKERGINEAVRRRFATFNALRKGKLLRSLLREKPDIRSLSLRHLQGGFSILVLGYVGGALVLVLEIISSTEFVRRKFNRRRINVE